MLRFGPQFGFPKAGGLPFSPKSLPSLSAWYDVSDFSSLRVDSANRVSLVGDKSGNSGVNCLVLPGSTANYASSPDSLATSITGDIDLRCDVAMNDWTPSAISSLIGKNNAGTNRSYYLAIFTGGTIILTLSQDGASDVLVASSVSTGFTDGTRNWIRATWRASDGQVQFFTGSDGVNWTQLGTNQSIAIASIFNGTQALNIGARNNGNSEPTAGRIYRAQILNGINGTVAFDANFSLAAKLATSFTESSANAATVTINTSGATGARISGERDLYQGTVANQPVYLPFTGTKYAYLNGTAGNFLSTPDSAAVSVTGDIDIRIDCALTAWKAASTQVLFDKGTNGTSDSFVFGVKPTTGFLLWNHQAVAGSYVGERLSTVAPVVSDYQRLQLRVSVDVDNGAGGYTVTFYTRSSGASLTDNSGWNQLGTPIVTAGTTSILDNTAPLQVGAQYSAGVTSPVSGQVYQATLLNGINGTLAFDFNAQNYSTGSTLLDASANAATITINGGAMIVTATGLYFDGVNDNVKAPPFALSQPETVQFVGQQVTWTINKSVFNGNAVGSTMALFQSTTTPTLAINAGSTAAGNSSLAVKTRALVSAVFNTTSSLLRVNKGTPQTGNAGAQGGGGFTLSAGQDGLNSANSVANEVAIYSTAQTTAQLNQFATYAASKWRF